MAVPVVLVTAGARPVTAVESGGFPMTPVDTLGEPVTLVDAGGEPITLINEDGSPAFLAYSAKEYLNGIAPYHWFDFINDRCLYASNDVGGVSGATGYSFSRASQGYYTNADGTLTLFGHNLLLRSQEFDNAAWSKGGGYNSTVTANSTAAPDGTTTADTLLASSAGGPANVILAFSYGVTSGTAYTLTFFAKAGTLSWIRLALSGYTSPANGGAYFNLSGAGAVGTVDAGYTGTITALADGWYRCSLSWTAGSTVTGELRCFLANANNDTAVERNGTSSVNLWGAQLETGSQATAYVPTTSAAASALRRGNRGVLIEGARTNLCLQSQTYANATWTKTNVSDTAFGTAIAAPDGTTTGLLLTENTTNAAHQITQSVTKAASNVQYAFSVMAKAGARSRIVLAPQIGANGVFAVFDLSGGQVGVATTTFGAGFTANSTSIRALTNGWYLCTTVFTTDTATTIVPTIQLDNGTGTGALSNSYAGVNGQGAYIWGAQLEAASFPSSYIPTTTAVTRAADVLTCAAGVSYPLSLWAEFERAVDTGGVEQVVCVDANSNNERAYLSVTGGDAFAAGQHAGGVQVALPTVAGALSVGVVYKGAGRFALNDVQAARGGTLATADTSAALPTAPTFMRFGQTEGGGNFFFGYIRRAAVFSSALSDANLQSVTG